MNKKTKSFLFSCFTVLLVITVVVVCGEILAQAWYLGNLYFWRSFVPDRELGWVAKPNADFDIEWYVGVTQHVVTNRYGLRDTKDPRALKQGKKVIIVQGDSNIFGYGVKSEDMWSTHLAKILGTRKQKYEIVNAGCSGYDLQHYVLQLEKLMPHYKPDLSFIVFNIKNDYQSALLSAAYMISRPHYDLVKGKLEYRRAQYRVPGQFYGLPFVMSLGKYTDRMIPYLQGINERRLVLSGIVGKSFLVHELYMRMWNTKWGRELLRKEPPVFSKTQIQTAQLYALGLWKYIDPWPTPYEEGKSLIKELFARHAALDANTVVLILPYRYEITDPAKIDADIQTLSDGTLTIDLNKPQRELKAILKEVGIPYIDLKPVFSSHPAPQSLYLEGNTHLGPLGHQLLAQVIADYLN